MTETKTDEQKINNVYEFIESVADKKINMCNSCINLESKLKIAVGCLKYVLDADPVNHREVIYDCLAKLKGEG
jgi:hypothetical protein